MLMFVRILALVAFLVSGGFLVTPVGAEETEEQASDTPTEEEPVEEEGCPCGADEEDICLPCE